MQIRQNCHSFNLTLPIIKKAQQTLLSPQEFYQLCQELSRERVPDPSQVKETNNLYFIITNPRDLFPNKSRLTSGYLLKMFDWLAVQIKKNTSKLPEKFYLQKVSIKLKKSKIYTFRTCCITHSVPQAKLEKNSRKPLSNTFGGNKLGTPIKLQVEIRGEGMIGRVAKVRINEGEDLALKVFFDSSLIWQHGPWGEIPVAIYLQAHQVTKNIPQFKFASSSWAVWEWIYPETKPDYRAGITYEEFAYKQGLTRLNYLNYNNYNPYQIRLDLGGIQKEYSGRRWHDFFVSLIFYKIKLRQEGLQFFQRYLTWKNIRYFTLRLISLIFSNFNKTNISKGLG